MMLGEESLRTINPSEKGMDFSSPVLIPIQRTDPNHESDDEEWAMIEINGELLNPSSVQVDTAADTNQSTLFDTKTRMELGSITFPEKETPVMIIGTHELRGSVVKLTQPFVVLQKSMGTPLDTTALATDATESTPTTTYQMVGVVHYKILFNQYPKSIMR